MRGAGLEGEAERPTEIGRPEHGVFTDEDDVHQVLDTGTGVTRGPVGAGVRVHLLGDMLIEGQSWEADGLDSGEGDEAGSEQEVRLCSPT